MLRAYLRRGGQITVLTDEENLAMPNLMSLMAAYGMSAEKGAVGEAITVKDNAAQEGENLEKTEFSSSVAVKVNTQHEALASLDQLSSLQTPTITGGNAISMQKDAQPSLLLTALLTTSTN
jgi:hypothetical protein